MTDRNRSQLGQDNWVLEQLKYKRDGTFVDIGCATPTFWSNTSKLELEYGWRGIGIDVKYDAQAWSVRPNTKVYQENAVTFDYIKAFEENDLPEIIDYLNVDLEPPTITFEAFKALPHDRYKFRTITFEQDAYRMPMGGWTGSGEEWKKYTREYICSLGYTFVREVTQDDWYVLRD